MLSAEDKRPNAEYSMSSSFRESESVVGKILPLLAKVKTAPNEAVIKEAHAELKHLQELLWKNNGIGDDPNVKKLLTQLVRYIMCQHATPEYNQCKQLSNILFPLLVVVGEFDDIKEFLRRELEILHHLGILFEKVTTPTERTMLLSLVEVYTRDISLQWKSSCLIDLVQHVLKFAHKYPAENLDLTMQILINICSRNDKCVLMLHDSDEKKSAWNIYRQAVAKENQEDVYLLSLMSHLNYVLEVFLPSKVFAAGFELTKTMLRQALKQHQNSERFLKRTLAVRQIVQTVCSQMKNILDEDYIRVTEEKGYEIEGISAAKMQVMQLVITCQEELYKFVFDHSKELHEDIKENILNMTIAFLIPYKASMKEPSLVSSCNAAAQTARRILTSTSRPRVQLLAYKCMLKVSELIFENPHLSKEDVSGFLSLFRDVARSLNLETDISLNGITLDLYTVSLKLFGYLVVDSSLRDHLRARLSQAVALALFNKTTAELPDYQHALRLSIFSVELLYLMKKLTPGEEIGIFLSFPAITAHVANCIRNGTESDIIRALQVTSGFKPDNLSLVSKSLRQQQEVIVSVPNTPDDLVPDVASSLTSHAIAGVNRSLVKDPKDCTNATSDLIELYEVRREVHQHEVTVLNKHIQQLSKTISNLNEMLLKQSAFFNRHVAMNAKRDMELTALQCRYDEETKTAESRIAKGERKIEEMKHENKKLEKSLVDVKEHLKSSEVTVASLKTENEGMAQTIASLQAQIKAAQKDLAEIQTKYHSLQRIYDAAQAKIAKLEDDIKLKEKDAEQLHVTLDKRQKIIDAIQGILGPNFAGRFDL